MSKPVIGILTQDTYNSKDFPDSKYVSIAASYVKWLESAGALVIPIPHYEDFDRIVFLMNKVNGILLMGGGTDLLNQTKSKTNFQNISELILNKALELNKKGDYFPVWGTCLGFESLMLWILGNGTEQKMMNDTNNHRNITFTNEDSSLKEHLTEDLITISETGEALYFYHHFYFSPEIQLQSSEFTNFFIITAKSKIPNSDIIMIAMIEGKSYPFYGVMFHPEKNQFEHNEKLNINNEANAIKLSQEISAFFVKEARKNNHEIQAKELDKLLIFNYPTTRSHGLFTEIYFLEKEKLNSVSRN